MNAHDAERFRADVIAEIGDLTSTTSRADEAAILASISPVCFGQALRLIFPRRRSAVSVDDCVALES
ncbi:hypothetical protein HRK28_19255 [Rathayibacter sp. VKM Ac-2835]|uniref:hypothetical protein n=1 Tax=Rathayibacter sp. VKM Ac-2835 TaxID=2739043 RepID=UPI001564C510|nr:hypothetical protein [Rathayibacter sp. VKM Ac-2835]NRG43051.1 hypothetical protein [Rathayibacter sp. VKM Ac-2835]